jgi:acetyltransferase-like isoleucine patch superfamily enzyme
MSNSGRRRRRCWGLFGGTVLACVLGGGFGVSPALAQTCRPGVGAQGAAPFTVWYCQGDQTGRQATTRVARLLDGVWAEETRPEPNGLGPPITPQANGGKISVYVTAPNEEVDLGACPEFCDTVGKNFGIAVGTAPFLQNPAGGPTSSGAMIVNENIGINDATVIHEFFHVLEFAHSGQAANSWLGEAAATWAEHRYRSTDISRVNFFRDFQRTTTSSLTRTNPAHHYGAYVWFVWLAQRAGGDRAVFQLWSALEAARSSDVAVIDPLVGGYLATLGLSWAGNFKDFAVEDLNRNLSRATPRLFGRGPSGDAAVPLNVTPRWLRPPSTLNLGTRRTGVNLALLSAQYEHIRAISRPVGAVVVTSNRMKPWGDLVVLAHTRFGWQRRDLQSGSVTFCRRLSRQNVDQLYLIADNHDDRQNRSGASYTVTGKRTC